MTNKKSRKAIWIILIVLIIIGAAAFYIIKNNRSADSEDTMVNEREYTAAMGDITVGIDSSGKLAAEKSPHTFSKDTVIEKIFVKSGDYVKKGDKLAELSISEAEKNHSRYEEAYNEAKEKLDSIESDKKDYLLELNWLLENEEEDNSDSYYDKVYTLNDEIDTLDNELDEAKWRKDYLDDDTYIDAAIAALEKQLQEKQSELDTVKADREKEEEQENDLVYQKERQEKKLQEFDDKISTAKNELELARYAMSQAESPFLLAKLDGVVTDVNYNGGETVADNKAVINIGDSSKMTLKLIIEPENINDVEVEQEVQFSVDAYPDITLKGKVLSKIFVPDTNGKYGAVVSVEETDCELLDGMAAGGTLIVKQKLNVLTLPNKVIELIDGKQFVKIRDQEDTLISKEITTGFSDGRMTEILSGLKDGDTVIYVG